MELETLVVEDEGVMRRLIEALVASRGHTVTGCANGDDALAAFAQRHHRLILLDWMMEGMDGLETCRRLRATREGADAVILMVTSRDKSEDLQAVLAAGADDYLTKPLDPERMNVRLAIAEMLVEQRAARRRAQKQLDATLVELERSHADLLSLLNGLGVGTALTDQDGILTFLNVTARDLLALTSKDPGEGRTWRAAFPFSDEVLARLGAIVGKPLAQRERISASTTREDARVSALEIEVLDDPRDPKRKIFVLYDVTEVHDLRSQLESGARFHDLVGKSAPMRQVYQLIRDVAEVDTTVLIEGETGTGKELVARGIHASSHRRDEAFIPVNCAGLTESLLSSQLFGHRRGAFTGAHQDHIGLFEAAEGGTIFLDEIGDIPLNVQANLLRVLQEREITRVGESKPRKINVRVVAATHRNLTDEVANGTFRADLFYRIRVARVNLPSLRKRREDIPLLAATFLRQVSAETGKPVKNLAVEAMGRLLDHDWPGNVRELRSAIEFGVIRCKGTILQGPDLPQEIAGESMGDPILEDGGDERTRIAAALKQTQGNRAAAARLLGISRATFYRRLTELEADGGAG